jgi:archaellum component FlaC
VRRLFPLVALSVVLAVLSAGCGGASQEEKFAGDVCTDISDWKSKLEQSADNIQSQLKSPGTGTLAAIDTEIQEAVDATEDLANDLKSVEPPDNESGTQAKDQLEALGSQLEATVEQAKKAAESLPESASASQIAEKLGPLIPAMQSLAVQTSRALESVKDSGEKLQDGFDKADSCDELR